MGFDIREVLRKLVEETAEMIQKEKDLTLEIVKKIGQLDRMYAAGNYMGGMPWQIFAERVLKLTPDQYVKRVRASRVLRSYPQVEEMIKKGEIHLSHAWVIYAKITPANSDLILENIKGMTKRETEAFLSRVTNDGRLLEKEGQHEIRLVLKESEMKVLDRAREVLSARGKTPTNTEILLKAVEDLLEKRDPIRKAKRAQAKKSAKRASAPGQVAKVQRREPVPAALKHQIMLRDGGQCTHIYSDGSRCQERGMIETDHIVPVALGGKNEFNNLRLVCRSHNFQAAAQVLGMMKMCRHRESGRFSNRAGQ